MAKKKPSMSNKTASSFVAAMTQGAKQVRDAADLFLVDTTGFRKVMLEVIAALRSAAGSETEKKVAEDVTKYCIELMSSTVQYNAQHRLIELSLPSRATPELRSEMIPVIRNLTAQALWYGRMLQSLEEYCEHFKARKTADKATGALLQACAAKQLKAMESKEKARAELDKRFLLNRGLTKTSALKAMAKEVTWGSLRKLHEYGKDIKTPRRSPKPTRREPGSAESP